MSYSINFRLEIEKSNNKQETFNKLDSELGEKVNDLCGWYKEHNDLLFTGAFDDSNWDSAKDDIEQFIKKQDKSVVLLLTEKCEDGEIYKTRFLYNETVLLKQNWG